MHLVGKVMSDSFGHPESNEGHILIALEFNPFKLNGISHSYDLEESISVLRIVRRYFSISFKS